MQESQIKDLLPLMICSLSTQSRFRFMRMGILSTH